MLFREFLDSQGLIGYFIAFLFFFLTLHTFFLFLFFPPFHLHYQPPSIISTLGAGPMGQYTGAAMRTNS